jgi:hypothetical protein
LLSHQAARFVVLLFSHFPCFCGLIDRLAVPPTRKHCHSRYDQATLFHFIFLYLTHFFLLFSLYFPILLVF